MKGQSKNIGLRWGHKLAKSLPYECETKYNHMGAALHRGTIGILASHPAAQDFILGVQNNFYRDVAEIY